MSLVHVRDAGPQAVLGAALRQAVRRSAVVVCVWMMGFGVDVSAFDLQGHRGARGMAPENTITGFETALAVGVHTLELDVGMTSDGVVVIGHDPALNVDLVRNSSGQWLRQLGMERGPTLRSLSLAELQTYDVGRIYPNSRYATTFAKQVPRDGERMPTLAALFERINALKADHVRFNIETKLVPSRPDDTYSPREFAVALLRVVDSHGMRGRVTVQSFDWRTLAIFSEIAGQVPRVYLSAQRPNFHTLNDGSWTLGRKLSDYRNAVALVIGVEGQQVPDGSAGVQLTGAIWSPHFADLTEELVKEAQSAGLKVVPWTVNEPGPAQQLIRWGVNGIITDYPQMLRDVMTALSMPLPSKVSVTPR